MKTQRQRLVVIVILLLLVTGLVQAQSYQPRVVTTAANFLTYTPDARAGAMGECGVATDADAFSMYYNPAKYAFMKSKHAMNALGIDLWTRRTLSSTFPINLYGAFAQKIGRSAIAVTLRHYRANGIEFRDEHNILIGTYSPREFAVDVAYSIRIGEFLSVGTASRFIYSNLTQGMSDFSRPGISFAGDIGVYYYRPLGNVVDLSLGASITNIGTKIGYNGASNKKDFIPTTMRLGTGVKFNFHPKHSLAVNLQFSKLLVPTPPLRDYNGNIIAGYDDDVSVFRGMIQSFYDAPGCGYNSSGELVEYGTFYEELCEINTGFGLEYNLADHFFARSGYYHRSILKGGGDYISSGLGMRFGIFGMNVSYNFPINTISGSYSGANILRWDMYFAF